MQFKLRTVKGWAGAASIAILLSACGQGSGEKAASSSNGPKGSRIFTATDFTGIELAGSDDVVVKQGAAFAVVATGPQAELDKLEILVENGILVVRRKNQTMSWSGNDDGVTVAVTMPQLTSAAVSGSGDLTADRASGDAFTGVLAGSGNLEIANVDAKAIKLSLAGSGDVTVKGGKSDSADISLAGSGDIDTTGLSLTSADISLAGSGDVSVTATTSAKVSVIGSGDVQVGGGAKCDSNEVGSGTVRCS